MSDRKVMIKRRVVQYVEQEVNLLDFLKQHTAELYISVETDSVEIRMPTRVDHYTHWVGSIPLGVVDVAKFKDDIIHNRVNQILEEYIDHVEMSSEYTDIVT